MLNLKIDPCPWPMVALIASCLLFGSCRKQDDGSTAVVDRAGEEPTEMMVLPADQLPSIGVIYKGQQDSKIRWQPWGQDALELAKQSKRLVLCVIAMPQQAGIHDALHQLSDDPRTLSLLNNYYVPVLIDGSVSREMATLSTQLCAEIKKNVSFPVFLWLTHRGDPVAWTPVMPSSQGSITDVLMQSHVMVKPTWEEDLKKMVRDEYSGYIFENSRHDNIKRRSKFENRRVNLELSEQPGPDVFRAIRQLTTLYNPYSQNLDGAGGMFPKGSIEFLAAAAIHPGVPKELRIRSRAVLQSLLDALIASPMVDPLDGGVFSARLGKSWAMPSFVRRCSDQGTTASAMLSAYHATGDERALQVALDAVRFAEASYQQEHGLFVMEYLQPADPKLWLWTIEELDQVLNKEQLAWWKEVSGLKDLGNLPLELDPQRKLFRKNALSLRKPPSEVAGKFSMEPELFAERFNQTKADLLAVREERLQSVTQGFSPNLEANLRMVSAYAALYGATGDEIHMAKAKRLMSLVVDSFYQNGKFKIHLASAKPTVNEGRAFHYALAMQVACDLATVTHDRTWMDWAAGVALQMDKYFGGDLFLMECSEEVELIDLPVEDRVMLFDDSTLGLTSMVSQRLNAQGLSLPERIEQRVNLLPAEVRDKPIPYTDYLRAALNRHHPCRLVVGKDLNPAMESAIRRLPLVVFDRLPASEGRPVPDGAIRLVIAGREDVIIKGPEALREALLPLAGD